MRSYPNIAITGTPGVGKSTLARRVVEHVNSRVANPSKDAAVAHPREDPLRLVDLNDEARDRGFRDSYDDELKAWIIDQVLLADAMSPEISTNGGFVMDWMHADFWLPDDGDEEVPLHEDEESIPPSQEALDRCPLDLVVTLRASNTTLYDRYKARDPEGEHYTDAKIQQNLDTEIFNVIGENNAEAFGRDSLERPDTGRGVVHVELTSDTERDMDENVAGIADWIERWRRASDQSDVTLDGQAQNGIASTSKGKKRKLVSYFHE